MSSLFRKNAVQAMVDSGESRARTALVTPRRALVALAVIAMLVAGLLYVAVSSLVTPAVGIGWADSGGFFTMAAPAAGEVSAPNLTTGRQLRKGEVIGELTTPEGKKTVLTAPGDAIVMQRGSPSDPYTVNAGDPIVNLGMLTEPAHLFIVLPGPQQTGLTEGNLAVGADVWVRPADAPSFQCTIVAYNAYEQDGASLAAYIPSPSVARFVQASGSVVTAGARCPGGNLDDLLVGRVLPVSVEVGSRSLLSFVFGGS